MVIVTHLQDLMSFRGFSSQIPSSKLSLRQLTASKAETSCAKLAAMEMQCVECVLLELCKPLLHLESYWVFSTHTVSRLLNDFLFCLIILLDFICLMSPVKFDVCV